MAYAPERLGNYALKLLTLGIYLDKRRFSLVPHEEPAVPQNLGDGIFEPNGIALFDFLSVLSVPLDFRSHILPKNFFGLFVHHFCAVAFAYENRLAVRGDIGALRVFGVYRPDDFAASVDKAHLPAVGMRRKEEVVCEALRCAKNHG